MRILYFADIRFPLERANGIQTMATCHALGERGHLVALVVRPDTHVPPRDPFAYYGLEPEARPPEGGSDRGAGRRGDAGGRDGILTIEHALVSGPATARRLEYLAYAAGRAAGRDRGDVVLTRDLGVASLLLRIPRSLRPPLVYESHGYAPEVAAALPDLLSTGSTATQPSARKLARLARREARVWHVADGYVTITEGLAQDMTARHGARARLAVVPDGTRVAGFGSRDSGLGIRDSGLGIRDSGLGIRDSGLGIRD